MRATPSSICDFRVFLISILFLTDLKSYIGSISLIILNLLVIIFFSKIEHVFLSIQNTPFLKTLITSNKVFSL